MDLITEETFAFLQFAAVYKALPDCLMFYGCRFVCCRRALWQQGGPVPVQQRGYNHHPHSRWCGKCDRSYRGKDGCTLIQGLPERSGMVWDAVRTDDEVDPSHG